MLPKRSAVAFQDLQQFLVGLGFTRSKRGKFWAFQHAASETAILYRAYRFRDRVTLLDVYRTRQELEACGIVPEDAFDELLNKATA